MVALPAISSASPRGPGPVQRNLSDVRKREGLRNGGAAIMGSVPNLQLPEHSSLGKHDPDFMSRQHGAGAVVQSARGAGPQY